MIYKTVFGEFKGLYIEAKEGLYWLTQPIVHKGSGYIMLRKTHRGSYEPLRILKVHI